jgi:D-arabinose 1-dehydrogenase-like Zn-dependent alcohol dehydrogenase
MIFGRRSIAGSLIGGIAETQEMLDFCAEHSIVSEIEMIPVQRSTRPMTGCRRATSNTASSSTARRWAKPPLASCRPLP